MMSTQRWRCWCALVALAALMSGVAARARTDLKNDPRNNEDLSLWIEGKVVKMFSGLNMEITVISNGNVMNYIRDPKFENYLPIIPNEMTYVNFTWKAGQKNYYYHFDMLESSDENILKPPVVSIRTKGRIPRRPKEFRIEMPCLGNQSGTAILGVGLRILNSNKKPLVGTPLRLRLRKECAKRSPDPECDKKCANQGRCNRDKMCQCPEGYMGQYCRTALCYPSCTNGGNCTSPGICSCPAGFQGRHCEGGICAEKCLNGGKCIQKDTCKCSRGYYGTHCEFSNCIIPCLNGGKCRGVNECKCPNGYGGDHCEIVHSGGGGGGKGRNRQRSGGGGGGGGGRKMRDRNRPNHVSFAPTWPTGSAGDGNNMSSEEDNEDECDPVCRHGRCVGSFCLCDDGWHGRMCHQRTN